MFGLVSKRRLVRYLRAYRASQLDVQQTLATVDPLMAKKSGAVAFSVMLMTGDILDGECDYGLIGYYRRWRNRKRQAKEEAEFEAEYEAEMAAMKAEEEEELRRDSID